MEDISSVQEVFTTQALQVVLYAALWTDPVKVPSTGRLPSDSAISSAEKGMHRTGAHWSRL